MKNVLFTFSLLSALWSIACNKDTSESDWLNDTSPAQQQEITQNIHDIFEAAKAKNLTQLDAYHLYGPKFTKFDDGDIRSRMDATQGQQNENELFSAIDSFQIQISNLKVDVFGQTAIATFTADYSARFQGQALGGKDRATMVFVQDGDKWKITHEHFSTW